MDLIALIKQAAMDAFNASKPTNIVRGTVVSVTPLKIQVSQMQTLESDFLVVPDYLTDKKVDVTVNWQYETGKKSMTTHNSLKKGDKVFMLRAAGGQEFYVIGRLP